MEGCTAWIRSEQRPTMDELLAVSLLVMVFAGTGLAMLYIRMLTRFFAELREREPQQWKAIGGPSLLNMLLLPFINFRKFYAFYPVLKARRHDPAYRYAHPAYRLLKTGLCFCIALFVNMIALVCAL